MVLVHHSGRAWWSSRVTHIMVAMEQRQCLNLQGSSFFCFDFVQTSSLWSGSVHIQETHMPKLISPGKSLMDSIDVRVNLARQVDKVNHGWVNNIRETMKSGESKKE